LRTVIEINNGVRGQGTAFEPEVVYEAFHPATSIAWSAGASLVVGDEQLNNYFYGVQAPFATAARPVYNAQAGLIATRLSLGASTRLGKDWRLFGFARLQSFSNAANRASPLYLQADGVSFGLGLTWTFARSERTAAE
jgi:outer membrane scaffolding protein for murein synthesis (MipA/OmpV family)